MEQNLNHREQNTALAKAVNHLKMQLRKSKHEVLSLRQKLQLSREQNVQLTEQQADLFQSVEDFENRLDEVFANNSYGYILLSTGIEKITVKNPRRSYSGIFNLSTSTDENGPTNNIPSVSNIFGEPRQSFQQSTAASVNDDAGNGGDDDDGEDVLNTAFLGDSDHESNVSIPLQPNRRSLLSKSLSALGRNSKLIKKPSRLPISILRATNVVQGADTSLPSIRQRRSIKVVDYREQPLNRKIRRIN